MSTLSISLTPTAPTRLSRHRSSTLPSSPLPLSSSSPAPTFLPLSSPALLNLPTDILTPDDLALLQSTADSTPNNAVSNASPQNPTLGLEAEFRLLERLVKTSDAHPYFLVRLAAIVLDVGSPSVAVGMFAKPAAKLPTPDPSLSSFLTHLKQAVEADVLRSFDASKSRTYHQPHTPTSTHRFPTTLPHRPSLPLSDALRLSFHRLSGVTPQEGVHRSSYESGGAFHERGAFWSNMSGKQAALSAFVGGSGGRGRGRGKRWTHQVVPGALPSTTELPKPPPLRPGALAGKPKSRITTGNKEWDESLATMAACSSSSTAALLIANAYPADRPLAASSTTKAAAPSTPTRSPPSTSTRSPPSTSTSSPTPSTSSGVPATPPSASPTTTKPSSKPAPSTLPSSSSIPSSSSSSHHHHVPSPDIAAEADAAVDALLAASLAASMGLADGAEDDEDPDEDDGERDTWGGPAGGVDPKRPALVRGGAHTGAALRAGVKVDVGGGVGGNGEVAGNGEGGGGPGREEDEEKKKQERFRACYMRKVAIETNHVESAFLLTEESSTSLVLLGFERGVVACQPQSEIKDEAKIRAILSDTIAAYALLTPLIADPSLLSLERIKEIHATLMRTASLSSTTSPSSSSAQTASFSQPHPDSSTSTSTSPPSTTCLKTTVICTPSSLPIPVTLSEPAAVSESALPLPQPPTTSTSSRPSQGIPLRRYQNQGSYTHPGVTRSTTGKTVTVSGAYSLEFCPWDEVDGEVEYACRMAKQWIKSWRNPFATASWIHLILIRCHPFDDGNGRVSRIIASIPLMRSGYPPISIALRQRPEYYTANSKTWEGEHSYFVDFILEGMKETLESVDILLAQASPESV